ncbi:MAG: hypothetical protein JWQ71_4532 [Pedosphaera sp.]|nr:hypothetical protein [Pedosphaera sp.]
MDYGLLLHAVEGGSPRHPQSAYFLYAGVVVARFYELLKSRVTVRAGWFIIWGERPNFYRGGYTCWSGKVHPVA